MPVKRRMRRRPGWVEPVTTPDAPATAPATPPSPPTPMNPNMTPAQNAQLAQLERGRAKLQEWQAQYAPELAPAKPPRPWQSKKVYGQGVVIETARARKLKTVLSAPANGNA